MASKYQDVTYGSFGGGMDQLSPESKIPDEYVELLDNMDPTPNGSLVKRTGTQLYGALPVRVERIEYDRMDYTSYDSALAYEPGDVVRVGASSYFRALSAVAIGQSPSLYPNLWESIGGGELCLFLDSSVDVLSLRSTPIYLYGRTSEGHAAGDLTDEARGIYYEEFTTDIRQPIIEATEVSQDPLEYAYTTTSVDIEGNTHDQGALLAANIYRSTSNSALVNELITGDSYAVDKLTADVTVDVTTGLVSEESTIAFESFLVVKSRASEPGQAYVYEGLVPCSASYPNPYSITITAATHNLSNFNVLIDCYADLGDSFERILPEDYTINSDGSVVLRFAHYTDFQLVACLYSTPAAQSFAQTTTGSEDGGAFNQTLVIEHIDTPFLFFQLFKDNNDGSRTAILGSTTSNALIDPSSSLTITEIDPGTADYRATFYISNESVNSFTTFALWDYGRLVSNKLCVEASDPATDTFQFLVPGTDHRLGAIVSTRLVQSTNPTNENNLVIGYDEVSTDITSTDVAIDLTNNTGAGFSAYAMLADRSEASGAYHSTATIPVGTTPDPGNPESTLPTVVSISAATHGKGASINVTSFRRVYDGATISAHKEIAPLELTISSTGNVTASFVNDGDASYELLLVVYPVADVLTGAGTIANGATGTLVIPGLINSFAFIHPYYIDLSGNRVRIVADRLSVNSIQGTASIQVTNNTLAAITLEARWDYADYVTQESIPTTSETGVGYRDTSPQITIWGLPHKQLYSGATGASPGYVTHVDTYRAQAEERAVSGLGGNLFAAYDYGEAAANYGLGEYFPNLRARVSNEVTIGPAFVGAGDLAVRTQGLLKFVNASANQAAIVSSSYVTVGQVKYRLYVPSLTVVGSLATIFNDREFLTVSGMGYSINNGEFRVISASLITGTDYLDVLVENEELDTADWNEANSDGRAGIFTDRIPLEVTCPFFEADRLLSASWGDEQLLLATGASAGNEVRVEGLHDSITVPDGLLLVGARTSRIIPIRSINAIPTTDNLVAGDILSFTGLERQLRSKFVNPRADELVTIPINSDNGDVVKPIGVQVRDSNLFQIGQRVLLLNAGIFTGEQIVSAIISPTKIEVAGDQLISVEIPGVILVGHNVEVDEPFDWYDSITSTVSFRTARRWLPIEEPGTNYLQLPPNRYRYFNSHAYDDQPFLRSTVVKDTMYLSNGVDAVQRYDGSSLTRAGFFRWQPGLYLTQDTTKSGISLTLPSVTGGDFLSVTANVFKVKPGFEKYFSKGDQLIFNRTVNAENLINEYTVTNTWQQSDGFIEVNANGQGITDGTARELARANIYSYYYRLNMVDVNGNRLASAVTGAEDAKILLTKSCSIRHLLLRPPFLDNFDFARIEIQVYRTKAGSSGPYYLISTVQPSWNQGGEAYLEFIDSINDADLKSVDQDVINVTLLGAELGQTWAGPLRSKYITSTSNSLILANIKSWPSLSLTPSKSPQVDRLRLPDFENRRILVRKSNTDTAIATNNTDRMGFEFVHEGQIAVDLTGATIDYDTNALTIVSPSAHGLAEGDWVYLFHYDPAPHAITNVNPRLGGYYQVYAVESSLIFSVRVSNAMLESIALYALSTIDINAFVKASNAKDVPVWISTDKLYGNYAANLLKTAGYSANFIKDSPNVTLVNGGTTVGLEVDGYLAGNEILPGTRVASITGLTTFTMNQGAKDAGNNKTFTVSSPSSIETYAFLRLANAINAAQAACELRGFVPWVVANAGGEYSGNQLLLETPYVSEDTLEVLLPAFANLNIYANGTRVDAGAQVQTRTQLFPSRLIVSYPNYPEIFDAPLSFLDTDSDSAIDINPSDGQEITGVIPFFGDSAFGAAQKDGILLVFKTASVYLVNISAKRQGLNAVQRLDTRGLGCTAPYSIAPTQNGIMFANQSGIYRISRNLECQYIGRRMERVWKEGVDTRELDTTMHGHYYPLGNQYKLSVPYKIDELEHPARVLVYNTVREYTADGYRDGSWTSYSNQAAIGWANMLRQSLFATPYGEVFTLRMTGTSTDYRDDGDAIEAVATLRAMDFGSSSIRKMVSSFSLQFRPEDKDSDVTVESAIDLIDNWETLDPAVISRQRTIANINNRATQQLSVIQYMSNKRKGTFYQLRISNGIVDQGLQLNGVSMMVAGLGAEGVIQARETGTRK